MRTAELDYDLPPDLIAQSAMEPRDAARLMVCQRASPGARHQVFRDLPGFLRRGDLLVLNRTRVIPARLLGRKDSGGAVEVLLVHPLDPGPGWRCLVRGKVRSGSVITVAGQPFTIAACHEDGHRDLLPPPGVDVITFADRHGHVPLPPYIARPDAASDRDRYQTVFADRPGSVAAPTAGLHFTPELLSRLDAQGIGRAYVDLAIGPGTFKPIDTDLVEDYRIHAEWCECPAATVDAIIATRAAGGRIIAVGTTAVRTLETAVGNDGTLKSFTGWTRLLLHPPQRPRIADGLITNFHLPRSSLLALVACFSDIATIRAHYAEAIAQRYRFYSYGDAMLIL